MRSKINCLYLLLGYILSLYLGPCEFVANRLTGLIYTGINQRCADRSLNSILYANRAAAQNHIGNIGSAFRDCFFARKFDPGNMKVSL